MSIESSQCDHSNLAIFILFENGTKIVIGDITVDYPPLLFWLMFWDEVPAGQIVNVHEYRDQKIGTLSAKALEGYTSLLANTPRYRKGSIWERSTIRAAGDRATGST